MPRRRWPRCNRKSNSTASQAATAADDAVAKAKAAQDQLDALTKQRADLAQEMQQREDTAKAALAAGRRRTG